MSEIDFFDFELILECQKRKSCKTEQLNRRVETRKYTNKCVRICLTVKIPRISPKIGEFEPKMGELRENLSEKWWSEIGRKNYQKHEKMLSDNDIGHPDFNCMFMVSFTVLFTDVRGCTGCTLRSGCPE